MLGRGPAAHGVAMVLNSTFQVRVTSVLDRSLAARLVAPLLSWWPRSSLRNSAAQLEAPLLPRCCPAAPAVPFVLSPKPLGSLDGLLPDGEPRCV